MSIENSPARPLSKLILSKSIHGDGTTRVSMELQVDCANVEAVAIVWHSRGGGTIVVGDGAIMAVSIDTRLMLDGVSEIAAVGAGVKLVALLVFIISGSVSNRQLRGFQPRSEIAC